MHSDPLVIAGRHFSSRLIVGTGKYPSHVVMADAHRASGADMVTVAVRRVNLTDPSTPLGAGRQESLIDYIDQSQIFLLPNTAGCYTADEAIRTARLGREVGLSNWVKLEVIGDERTLFPDNVALLEATRVLVQEGFVVMPYTNDDPVVCRKLEEAGAAAVMPLGAPIGSGLGIQNPNNIRIIKAQARVPVIVDAGVGTASDAAIAMELGADGVLMNTAIALAHDPVAMAGAMKLAVEAGRLAYLAGRIPRREFASPSSPTEGLIGTGTQGPATTQPERGAGEKFAEGGSPSENARGRLGAEALAKTAGPARTERPRPERGAGGESAEGGSPSESARGWGPARIEK